MSSRDTEVVQQFNAELSSLYEVRPPISKAKMSQITRVSMKAIKMYKHIVQSVERFIIKCRPEYKIPGLYVIDSIVRQSRHQFGVDKDVYAARFARNFNQTFQNLFLTCPPDDKPKIVRVLNLWQRNNVFTAETIQPLLDMANPNVSLSQMKFESSPQSNPSRDTARESSRDTNPALKDPNLILQLQQLANSLGLNKTANTSSDSQQETQNQIKFNKKLLDFDYGDEEDEEERGETPTEAEPPIRSGAVDDNNVTNPLALSMAQNLLSNPDLLQQLQQMQKTIQQTELLKLSISELEAHGLTNLGQQSGSGQQFINSFQAQQQNQSLINCENNNNSDENRKQIELNVNFEGLEQKLNNNSNDCKLNPNLNSNENSFQYLNNNFGPQLRANNDLSYALSNSITDGNQYHQQNQQFHQQFPQSSQEINERSGSQSPRSRSPRRSRFGRYRDRSRSRSPRNRRDRDRDSRRNYRSRSRSPRNSRFNDRSRSPQSYERERERERRRKGLPPIRKGCLTICSTTLWLGHVPKLVSEADLSDTFGEFGAINSIDLIPSRGCAYVCMNRRQDASKALNSLRNHKLHGSVIKMAWAPGKGMKGKEYKDYWEVDEGASYIPYTKLPEDVDLDLLEEGGTVDEDTVPEKLQEIRKRKNKEREEQERETAAMMARAAAMMPMPMVGLSANTFGVTGLVMPPNMLNMSQPPVLSLQSNEPSMLSTVTTTSFPQMSAPLMAATDESHGNKSEITEVSMTIDNSQSIDTKSDSKSIASNPSGPLFPPPLPPFQTLTMPPLPPILGSQPPPRMPWLSGPPPPIMPGNRMPVSPQRPPLLPLSSTQTATTDSILTPIRLDGHTGGIGQPMTKHEDRPPLIATLPPLAIPHDDLPQRLHPERPMDRMDRNFGPRDRFRPNMERQELDRNHQNDDPFAPSVYELRAMERNQQMMRPPIPHQMGGTGRSALLQMPHNMSERFPFEPQRHQRPYHPRHHNMRPDIRHHHNFDRHSNQQNRGTGREQYPNRGFGRRDRPSRWKSDDRHEGRHYNRNNNNNSEYNSSFNSKYDKRQDREEREDRDQSDEPFDCNIDNSFGDNNCNNNNETIDWNTSHENNSTNDESIHSNSVSIESDFQTITNIEVDISVGNRDQISNNNNNENISESLDVSVKTEISVENT